MDDAAEFTAAAALDSTTPRYLRIAGDQISARGLVDIASEVTKEKFKLFRPGGLKTYETLIEFTRTVFPQGKALYPPWQGLQYLHNMFSGRAKLEPLDNDRYPGVRWTTVRDVLAGTLIVVRNPMAKTSRISSMGRTSSKSFLFRMSIG